jgi:hypothetical protein
MRFCFAQSQVHPGSGVSVAPDGAASDPAACLVEFADGVVVQGRYRFLADRSIVLDVPTHVARKATTVAAERWRLKPTRTVGWTVAGKA